MCASWQSDIALNPPSPHHASHSLHAQPRKSNSTTTILNELLSRGAPLDERDQNGWTPLHCAASNGTLSACLLLLDAGADHDARSASGSRPLHYFVRVPLAAVASCVVTTAYVRARLAKLSSLQQVASVEHRLPCEGIAHAATAAAGTSTGGSGTDGVSTLDPESQMAAANYVKVLHKWEEMGADVDCLDNKGETPLHCAAFRGRLHNVAWLLNCGANLNTKNHAGETPLLLAVQCGCHDSVLMLLRAGADPEACSSRGSCVDFAVTGGHAEILESLTVAVKRKRRSGGGSAELSTETHSQSPLLASPLLTRADTPSPSPADGAGTTAEKDGTLSREMLIDSRNQPWQVVFNGPFLITPQLRRLRHLRAITGRCCDHVL
jgi:ankyrin repeat protein